MSNHKELAPPQGELEAALEHIWGAGLDWATSEDFQSLSDDERDATYIHYQATVINKAKALIAQREQEAYQRGREDFEAAIAPRLQGLLTQVKELQEQLRGKE